MTWCIWLCQCFGHCRDSAESTATFRNSMQIRGPFAHRLRVACTFSLHIFFAWRADIAFMQGSFCSAHVISLHLALFPHVSSALLVVPARSLRHHIPVRTVFVELYPSQKRGSSALPHERWGVWLLGRSHALSYEPTWPLLETVTRRPSMIQTAMSSLTSRKPHARTLDCSVFPQCLKPLFRTFHMVVLLFRESQESMPRETVARQGKRRNRRVDVKEVSTEQYWD